MSLFTFFGVKDRTKPEDTGLSEVIANAIEGKETLEEPVNKPVIKPQRLATIIEMESVEHFEQPPQEEEDKQ